jgi:hypothetical protein
MPTPDDSVSVNEAAAGAVFEKANSRRNIVVTLSDLLHPAATFIELILLT